MFKTFAAAVIAGFACAFDYDTEFMIHIAKYGIQIITLEEYNFRKEIFNANQKLN